MEDPPKPKHDHNLLKFPRGFLWGVATSAFQTEGENVYSDWWQWEQKNLPEIDRSKMAANEYYLYEEDFKIAQELNLNAYRLSLEWSRIEPTEGKFVDSEIDHYKKVLESLNKKGFKVALTLHHFSNPLWFAKLGGWANRKSPFYFERFVKKIVPEYKKFVDLWITINEPITYTYLAYRTSVFPPAKKSWWRFLNATLNMARAHKKAYRIIHELVDGAKVGFANNVTSYSAFHEHKLLSNLSAYFANLFSNHFFYKLIGNTNDFLGLNYYMNKYITENSTQSLLPDIVDIKKGQADISDLGWEVFPEGIFKVLMDFSDYKLPIYITENGIASTNDDRRVRFLLSYLKEVYHAIELKVPVKGYFYWSLIDNMELASGFSPRFGLVEVDFKTQKRTLRPSASVYADIAKNNGILHHMLKLLGHSTRVKDVIKEL